MSCLQLTLVYIVLLSNVALIFGAPISDYKSHTHAIDDREVKVTSHVNIGLPDQDSSSAVRSPVQSHEIQFGEDASMHIKIDISITPEMLANAGESGKADYAGPEPLRNLPEGSDVSEFPSGIKQEPPNPFNIIKNGLENKQEEAKNDIVGGIAEITDKKEPMLDVKSKVDPLINGKISEKNPSENLNDVLKPKSINEESETNTGESLQEYGDELEDEDEDELLHELEPVELDDEVAENGEENIAENGEEKITEKGEEKITENDKAKDKGGDDGVENHEGEVAEDEEEYEDFEELDDDLEEDD